MDTHLTLQVTEQDGRLVFKPREDRSGGGLVFDPHEDRITITKAGDYKIGFEADGLFFLNPVRVGTEPHYPDWVGGLVQFVFEVHGAAEDRGQSWTFTIPTTAGPLDPVIVNQVEGGGGGWWRPEPLIRAERGRTRGSRTSAG